MRRHLHVTAIVSLGAWCLAGCNGPTRKIADLQNQAAELRKENRKLVGTVEAQAKRIAKLEETVTNCLQLGQEHLDKVYSVSRIKIGRRSGGADYDGLLGDDGITVYLDLYDQDGHKFKAAGEIDIYIHDLHDLQHPELIAQYKLDVDQAKRHWFGRLLTYHYKVECLWQHPPKARKTRATVTFLDYLTGRVFEDSKEFEITPPPTGYSVESR